MDLFEAVRKRRSIRAFKPDALPQAIMKEIVELSLSAPSWGNTQPWELAVVSGKKLDEIKKAFLEKSEEVPNPDISMPRGVPDVYHTRHRAVGLRLFEIMNIKRGDEKGKMWWHRRGLELFGAPGAVYIYIDRSFYEQGDLVNIWPVLDCGFIMQNIMLLATGHGLGTIPSMQAVFFPDVLREKLELPDSKLMVLGIAVGYPDWDEDVNQFRSDRDEPANMVRWYGFDQSE